jgi:hypothetical protein
VSEPAAPRRSLRDAIVGWTVYPLGDLVAQLIGGHVQWQRLVVMAIAGGVIYRFEVPRWFRLLDRFEFDEATVARKRFARLLARPDRHLNWIGRTLGAILYFNPLWIARHMLFIRLAADPASLLHGAAYLATLTAACKSFVVNLPISLAGNYLIQMRVPLRWRFLASSIFSAMLATAYALAYRFF